MSELNELLKLCEAAGETKLDAKDIERLEAANDPKKALDYAKRKDRGFNATTYAAMKTKQDKDKYKREVPGAADVIKKSGGKLEGRARNRFFAHKHGKKVMSEKKAVQVSSGGGGARLFFEKNTKVDGIVSSSNSQMQVNEGTGSGGGGARLFFEKNTKIGETVPDVGGNPPMV